MKLFGYPAQGRPAEEIVPSELAEVALNATPAELRKMADFLAFCAGEMERMGLTYDHIHLSDRMKEFEPSPQFVVMMSSEK